MKHVGFIRWYDRGKGFGVISTCFIGRKNCEDVFIHKSCWNGRNSISSDFPLCFELRERESYEKGNYEAHNCKFFDNTLDLWDFVFKCKNSNLIVDSEKGHKNIMQECVRQINDEKSASNFIGSFKKYYENHPISSLADLEDYFEGGKNIGETTFQDFLRQVCVSFSFDLRKDGFMNGVIPLYSFTDMECISLVDFLGKNDLYLLVDSNPQLYRRLLKEKILHLVHKITFDPNFDAKTYDGLNLFYKDYENCVDSKELGEFKDLVSEELLGRENEFTNRMSDLAKENNPFAIKSCLDKLSICLNSNSYGHFCLQTESIVKQNSDLLCVLNLMTMKVIAIDEDYILEGLQNGMIESIDMCLDLIEKSTFFSSYLSYMALLVSLAKEGNKSSVLRWYKERTDIRTVERTEKIKNLIKETLREEESVFIDYLPLYMEFLGEDYVYDVTIEFLRKTHDSLRPLSQIVNLKNADSYVGRIINFLVQAPHTEKDLIDSKFVKPLCEKCKNFEFINSEYIEDVLKVYAVNTHEFEKTLIYSLSFEEIVKKNIEVFLLSYLSPQSYMVLWEKEKCDFLPDQYLNVFFDDKLGKYSKIDNWIEDGRIKQNGVYRAMINALKNTKSVYAHKSFKTQFNIYNYLLNKRWGTDYLMDVNQTWKDYFDWYNNMSPISYEKICDYFILFPENAQIKIFKYLFLCINMGEMQIGVNDLQNLNHCHPDFLQCGEAQKPQMCFSVSFVIEALKLYEQSHEFSMGKSLNELLYQNLRRRRLPTVESFFDPCMGKKRRQLPTKENVKKFIYPYLDKADVRWYVIDFPYDSAVVEELKTISGRQYDRWYKIWRVPENSIVQLEIFAKKNKFAFLKRDQEEKKVGASFTSLSFDDNDFRDAVWFSSELQESKEKSQLAFCEGYESQKEYGVWWCVGHFPCNDCTIQIHSSCDWEKYTLLDFCYILGYEVAEKNRYGQFEFGNYVRFVAQINRLKNLIVRLTCKRCGGVLYPKELNYSVNAVTTFYCDNKECTEYQKGIYLNHCYNRRCGSVIDSRESIQCTNGLYICKECGTCCTKGMFEYRLKRLKEVGCSNNRLLEDLNSKIEHGLDHTNKILCYKCGNEISLPTTTDTVCEKCGSPITYLFKMYNDNRYKF